MSDLDDKIDNLLRLTAELADASPSACSDEVADMKGAARDLELARRAANIANTEKWAGFAVIAGTAISGIFCVRKVLRPSVLRKCYINAAAGGAAGGAAAGIGRENERLAFDEMDAATDALKRATDKLCKCIMRVLY